MRSVARVYLGLDPGVKGAIAAVKVYEDGSQTWGVIALEKYVQGTVDEAIKDAIQVVARISPKSRSCSAVSLAVLEEVSAFPKMSRVSAFNLGQSFGAMESALHCLGIPMVTIRPADWQRKLQCRTGGDKQVSVTKASRLIPQVKWTKDTADAGLLAFLAMQIDKNTTTEDGDDE